MSTAAARILAHLDVVAAERAARASDPALEARVVSLKRYQQSRFRRGYGDLLDSPRYGAAARFFLEELYGPDDFSDRDAQFARIVPALVRLFPDEIVDTVETLGALHALSERLDSRMAAALGDGAIRPAAYVRAWQATGEPELREDQVRLTLAVGRALDGFTRNPVLRHSLKLMRGPARAAGLGELQAFLERGFDAFRGMRGADGFLDLVANRERALMRRLFEVELPASDDAALSQGSDDPLVQLP